ncbi:hypothetical protein HY500_04445 [Candidatus Woesearchaeota archaeon]|nr:hypothetical protein [Candidatus Woesearchaeota archaeon]
MIKESTQYVLEFITVVYLSDITARTIVTESIRRKVGKGSIPKSLIAVIIHPIRSQDEITELEREIHKNEGYYTPSF